MYSTLINVSEIPSVQRERLIAALSEEENIRLLGGISALDVGSGANQENVRRPLFQRALKRPPLFAAIEEKDITKVRSLLASSSSSMSHMRDPLTKSTPLIICAGKCTSQLDLDIASLLLQGASSLDCNLQNSLGDTALLTLLQNTSVQGPSATLLLMLLQQSEINIELVNASGNSCFHLAAEHGHVAVFSFFQSNDATFPNVAFEPNNLGETPLYLASRFGRTEIVSILVADARVRLHQLNTSLAYSSLHIAVLQRQSACLKALLLSPFVSTSVNLPNKEFYTPLYLALETNFDEGRVMLISHGADPRIGRQHRQVPSLLVLDFVPLHLAWLGGAQLTVLDLSRCHLTVCPVEMFRLKQLRVVNLSSNRLEVIPRLLVDSFTLLEELILTDNSLRVLSMDLALLKNLRVLQVGGNPDVPTDLAPIILAFISKSATLDLSALHLENITVDALNSCVTHLKEIALNNNLLKNAQFLESFSELSHLWIHDNLLDKLPLVSSIELLKLSGNRLSSIAELSELRRLREVWVESNLLVRLPLNCCGPSLARLWLDGNAISVIEPPGSGLPHVLRCLSLKNNQIREIPSVFVTSLEKLWLDGNLIEHLPASFASQMNHIHTLSLNGNPLRAFPSQIAKLVTLVELGLNDCLLEQIDPGIGNLTSLLKLGLQNNRLQVLPQTIGHLTRLTVLDVRGNNDLSSPPRETVKNGTAAIVGFLHDLIADSRPSYRMKLMIVGQEAVGKTSLLRSIVSKQRKSTLFGNRRALTKAPLSTDGIDIDQWDAKVQLQSGEKIKINFRSWDFAGQEVYYLTHAFFLSDRSVYMVAWSLKAPMEQQRVRYWLQSIQSRAPKAPIILVGTHAECMTPEDLSIFGTSILAELREEFPNLNIASFTGFSLPNQLSLKPLLDSLISTTLAQPFMGEPLPTLYMALEAAVISERKRIPPVMTWDEFQRLGISCGLLREEELLRAVVLLHEMGSLFFFKPLAKVSFSSLAMVVLDPQWLTRVMAEIITTKKGFVVNGILDHKNIGFMWKAPEYPDALHAPLLHLLQSFDILFRMDGSSDPHVGRSLVPFMLPARVTSEEMLKWARINEYAVTLGRIFEFEFLPPGFFGRLIVRLLHMAKMEEVWADLVVLSIGESIARVSWEESTVRLTVQGAGYDESLLQLLKIAVQSLESLAEEWFQIRAVTRVPCVHCLQQPASSRQNPNLFDLRECEQAASSGHAYVDCRGNFPVSLAALCPDVIVSTELPVFQWASMDNCVQVGEGTFAVVFRASLEGRLVAVKRLVDEADYRELRRESASLMSLRHPNIVELLGICYKPAALVTEYMAKGSLFDYLQDDTVSISWARRLDHARDICAGLKFLHNTTPPVLHRDLVRLLSCLFFLGDCLVLFSYLTSHTTLLPFFPEKQETSLALFSFSFEILTFPSFSGYRCLFVLFSLLLLLLTFFF